LWGFVGSTYARFSSFPVGPSAIVADLAGLPAGRRPRHLGHNPLGSLMALALLAIVTITVITGVVTLAGVDKQGPLAFVTSYGAGKATQSVHQALAYSLLVLIAGHLLGVVYEAVHGQPDLVRAMVTGEKAASVYSVGASPRRARPILAALVLVLLLAVAARAVVALSARPAFGVPAGPLDPIYAQECGSCHMAYPPSLVPGPRWVAILANLSDHFGEDASLEPDIAHIRTYLTTNSAEKWDTRAAHELALPDPEDPLRLTAGPFWTSVHRHIRESVFTSKAVGAKSACDKCHADAPTGRFDPQNTRVPERAFQ
jgi:cytochrome b